MSTSFLTRPRRRLAIRFATIAAAAVLAACSHNPPPSPQLGTPEANVLVTVTNRSVSDVDVFLNVSGINQRLGTVTSQATQSFEVRWDRIGSASTVALLVAPIGGGGAYRTGSLTLRPGSQVSVNAAPTLRNSTTQVY